MARLEDLPILQGKPIEMVSSLVRWISEHIKRVRWTNEEMRKKWCVRSAAEIVEDGTTAYIGPCLDDSLVAMAILQKSGGDAVLVMQEVWDPKYAQGLPFPQGISVHFGIEMQSDGRGYFFDFNTLNRVVFGQGNYRNVKEGVREIRRTLVPGKKIKVTDTIAEMCGAKTMEELDRKIEGYSFTATRERAIGANTDETYRNHCRVIGGEDFTLRMVVV